MVTAMKCSSDKHFTEWNIHWNYILKNMQPMKGQINRKEKLIDRNRCFLMIPFRSFLTVPIVKTWRHSFSFASFPLAFVPITRRCNPLQFEQCTIRLRSSRNSKQMVRPTFSFVYRLILSRTTSCVEHSR